MRLPLISCLLLIFYRNSAQCPYPATLIAKNGTCTGDKITVQSSHALAKIIWYRNGMPVDSLLGTRKFGSLVVVAGNNGYGAAQNQLGRISDMFVDDDGDIFVADAEHNRVQKWIPGALSGVTVAGGNGRGNAPNQLDIPYSISVDKSGNIFVLDENNYNYRITKWAPGAGVGTVVFGGNGRGDAPNQLFFPRDIYLDCMGGFYITDSRQFGGGAIKYLASGTTRAVIIAGYDPAVISDYQFGSPGSIGLDGQGNIYVTDAGVDCVAEIKRGETTGTRIIGGRDMGAEKPVLPFPTGIYVDYYGNVTVGDQLKESRWKPDYSTGTTLIENPAGIYNNGVSTFADNKGNIYFTASPQASNTGNGFDGAVYKLPLNVNIDSTLIATATGTYYAIVTDVNGYTVSTDSIKINSPPAFPPSVKISATDSNVFICTPIDFTAIPSNLVSPPSFQWQVSGVNAGSNSITYSNNIFANGDQVYCIMSSNDGCNNILDTSNIISLKIDPEGHATLTITASENPICAGIPIQFTSKLINGSNTPVYEWLLNGNDTGDSDAVYSNPDLKNGDVIYCLITSDASCGLAKSNSVPITVFPQPTIESGAVYNIPNGTSMTIYPVVTGDVADYSWSPGTYLSDSTARNPVVTPKSDIEYLVKIISVNGCADSGIIKINVYTPLRVPNAFTPNGDGKNDVFYVIGGPQGSSILDFSIFNRWGQRVFQARNIPTGSSSSGWNGYMNGSPAPEGTYVYFVNMNDGSGHTHLYNGTVTLIR